MFVWLCVCVWVGGWVCWDIRCRLACLQKKSVPFMINAVDFLSLFFFFFFSLYTQRVVEWGAGAVWLLRARSQLKF